MTGFSRFSLARVPLLLALPLCLLLCACARAEAPTDPSPQSATAAPAAAVPPLAAPASAMPAQASPGSQTNGIEDAWKPLWGRLAQDGLATDDVAALFARLGDKPSQEPMGRKVEELYTNKFLRQAKPPAPIDPTPNTTGIPRPWFKGVVTEANAKRCRAFITANPEAFRAAYEAYGVPPEVAAALLFVETRLGEHLGSQNAFVTLASMAASRSPEQIPDWLARLPDTADRMDWISERMETKADWAYNEFKALLVHSFANNADPFAIPCSAYGAIGLCQFMPSNLPLFAADGDDDGLIDLFAPADAVASLSRYLAKNGWKKNLSVPEQIKVLRRYNNMAVYANTILALAAKTRAIPAKP